MCNQVAIDFEPLQGEGKPPHINDSESWGFCDKVHGGVPLPDGVYRGCVDSVGEWGCREEYDGDQRFLME